MAGVFACSNATSFFMLLCFGSRLAVYISATAWAALMQVAPAGHCCRSESAHEKGCGAENGGQQMSIFKISEASLCKLLCFSLLFKNGV